MDYLNLISVPAIATAVYLIIEILKKAFKLGIHKGLRR